MASTPSDPIPFEEFAADVARRRRLFSLGEVPRNSGLRRTASKRALLAAIEELGGKW
jgi:hypothetical protein